MKPFEPVIKPFEGDFYSIYEMNGVKQIHVFGYSYEHPELEWANVECVGFIFELDEFVRQYKKYGYELIDYWYCELNQYQDNYTGTEMVDVINQYFGGEHANAYLGFEEITEETACGNYVNIYRYGKEN